VKAGDREYLRLEIATQLLASQWEYSGTGNVPTDAFLFDCIDLADRLIDVNRLYRSRKREAQEIG
jgi:hypothetical protein